MAGNINVAKNNAKIFNRGVSSSTSFTPVLALTPMTTLQRDSFQAENGMVIYNSDDSEFQGYQAGSWTALI